MGTQAQDTCSHVPGTPTLSPGGRFMCEFTCHGKPAQQFLCEFACQTADLLCRCCDLYINLHASRAHCLLAGWPAGVARVCDVSIKNACKDTWFHVCVKIVVNHAREHTCKRATRTRVHAFGLDEKLTVATSIVFYTSKGVFLYT